MMNLLILFLGQIPEAVFLAWFLIFSKGIRKNRILFTILMIAEYLIIMNLFEYNWLFHIIYTITTFLTLKILYKDESYITDVFIFVIGYIIIIISSLFCYLISKSNVVIASIINRLIIFIPLLVLNYKLSSIQNIYKKYWNRNDKIKKKMKSATFRSLNIIIFNLSFYVINACMVLALIMKNGGV